MKQALHESNAFFEKFNVSQACQRSVEKRNGLTLQALQEHLLARLEDETMCAFRQFVHAWLCTNAMRDNRASQKTLATWKARQAENATTVVASFDVRKKLLEAGKGLELVAAKARDLVSIIDVLTKRVYDYQELSSLFADGKLNENAKMYREEMCSK